VLPDHIDAAPYAFISDGRLNPAGPVRQRSQHAGLCRISGLIDPYRGLGAVPDARQRISEGASPQLPRYRAALRFVPADDMPRYMKPRFVWTRPPFVPLVPRATPDL